MKFLLAAVNAKYIHSNLGIYSLKRYAEEMQEREKKRQGEQKKTKDWDIEIGEYTINHETEEILMDIYRKAPDALGFSCYIWNISCIEGLVKDLKKILPNTEIWLGGPEASYRAEELLKKEPALRGIMAGEGEETFYRLLEQAKGGEGGIWSDEALKGIPGIAFREQGGGIFVTPPAPLMELSKIPFSYAGLKGFENRIIYYESSRGCPFSCSYCLSSIDKTVRFRDLDLVKRELTYFLEHKVPQVKFVDRTFNCKKSHSMEIWRFIRDHDNGITNFHFEISADLLSEEELSLLREMRPGLVQLEIGVQTTNPDTIREIRRRMDLVRLKENVHQINSFHNIHQHLDLIAGLPFEGYDSFRQSFNDVYGMEPEQLQLGFLKVLAGSYMMEMREEYGLLFRDTPPYEVLETKWLPYSQIIRLKRVEEMVEVYYNSGQFRNTVKLLEEEFSSPFDMYEALAVYYEKRNLFSVSHSRIARYELLFDFIKLVLDGEDKEGSLPDSCEEEKSLRLEEYRDRLMVDLYLRENAKSRPSFGRDLSPYKEDVKQFFIAEGKNPRYLSGYEGYDSRQMSKMAHVEIMRDGKMLLFDYLHRDALLGNAAAYEVGWIKEKREREEK